MFGKKKMLGTLVKYSHETAKASPQMVLDAMRKALNDQINKLTNIEDAGSYEMELLIYNTERESGITDEQCFINKLEKSGIGIKIKRPQPGWDSSSEVYGTIKIKDDKFKLSIDPEKLDGLLKEREEIKRVNAEINEETETYRKEIEKFQKKYVGVKPDKGEFVGEIWPI